MNAELQALPSADQAHLVAWAMGPMTINADSAVMAARDLGAGYLNGLQPPMFDSDIAAAYDEPANDALYGTGSGEGSGETTLEPSNLDYVASGEPDANDEPAFQIYDRENNPSGPE